MAKRILTLICSTVDQQLLHWGLTGATPFNLSTTYKVAGTLINPFYRWGTDRLRYYPKVTKLTGNTSSTGT